MEDDASIVDVDASIVDDDLQGDRSKTENEKDVTEDAGKGA